MAVEPRAFCSVLSCWLSVIHDGALYSGFVWTTDGYRSKLPLCTIKTDRFFKIERFRGPVVFYFFPKYYNFTVQF